MFSLLSIKLYAQQDQEPHYTQFLFNKMVINPAFTGLKENWDFGVFYRNQWARMNGAPENILFNIQHGLSNQKLGLGGYIMNDKIGLENRLNTFFSGAYHIKRENDIFSLGLQCGIRAFFLNSSELDPKDKDDAALYSGFKNPVTPDFKFGFNYMHKDFYAGFSISHLNQSKFRYAYNLDQSNLKRHYYINAGYNYVIDPVYTLKPSVMLRWVPGTKVVGDVCAVIDYSKKYWAGLNFRSKDAIGFIIGINLDNFEAIKYDMKIGYAYDYTLSSVRNKLGNSHEIMITYNPKKVEKKHTQKFQRLEF